MPGEMQVAHVSNYCSEMCLQVFYQSVSGFDDNFHKMTYFNVEI